MKEQRLSIADVSQSAEEENSCHTRKVNHAVISDMSGGLSFCGLELMKCSDRRYIKYKQLDRPLFKFDGKIEIGSSIFTPYSKTFEVESVPHLQETVTEVLSKRYGFDTEIDIKTCDFERNFNCQTNSQESSSENIKYKKKHYIRYTILPIGSFVIDSEIRKLSSEAEKELKHLLYFS